MQNKTVNTPCFLNFYDMLPKKITVFPRISINETVCLHKHNYVEFTFVTNGKYSHLFNGINESIVYGDAYILNTNDAHQIFSCEIKNSSHTDFLIELEFFKKMCNFYSPELTKKFLSGNGVKLKLSAETIAKIESYIPSLYLYTNEKSYSLSAKLLCSIVIELISSSYSEHTSSMPDWLLSLLDDLAKHNNFTTDLSTIVSKYNYNTNYMRRIFKQYTGMSMTDYFNRQKGDYAYLLLSTTNLPVESICEEIGFLNISYFYHLFKTLYNKTPNQVRNNRLTPSTPTIIP